MRRFALAAVVSLIAATPAAAQELLLFGGQGHDVFLGCLNCGEYSSSSVCNEYGYGNEYRSDSIFNEYGSFGNEYSDQSPWNEYSSSEAVPVLVDANGTFHGYFTLNKLRGDAVPFADKLQDIYENSEGDLDIVRNFLCS